MELQHFFSFFFLLLYIYYIIILITCLKDQAIGNWRGVRPQSSCPGGQLCVTAVGRAKAITIQALNLYRRREEAVHASCSLQLHFTPLHSTAEVIQLLACIAIYSSKWMDRIVAAAGRHTSAGAAGGGWSRSRCRLGQPLPNSGVREGWARISGVGCKRFSFRSILFSCRQLSILAWPCRQLQEASKEKDGAPVRAAGWWWRWGLVP